MWDPTIAYAVSQTARHVHQWRAEHAQAQKHILAYLAGNATNELIYRRQQQLQKIGSVAVTFTDSSFADSVEDRKSHSGQLDFIYGNPVSWRSVRQSHIATSPQHAETNACDGGARHLVWMRKLLDDFGHPETSASALFVDNKGLISSTLNTPRHQTNKHLDVKLFYKNELQESKIISVRYLETSRLTADALTKQLQRVSFVKHLRIMLGMEYLPEKDGIDLIDANPVLRDFQAAGYALPT